METHLCLNFVRHNACDILYYIALLITNNTQKKKRKTLISFGVILSLLPLTFFKYFNFINECISEGLSVIGLNFNLPGLNWAIPIGISFYTFQALGYMWDVYYKRHEAEHDFLTYALFVSFFPSILSGLINKASLIIPQITVLPDYKNYTGLSCFLASFLYSIQIYADFAGYP